MMVEKRKNKRPSVVELSKPIITKSATRLRHNFWRRYHQSFIVVGLVSSLYIIAWLVASYLMYRRLPDNFQQPNFYAEDGGVFAYNIINHGFWHALISTFNGYYVWGIYLLEQVGFIVDK